MAAGDGEGLSVGCKIANDLDRAKAVKIPRLLVDTGSEYTWVPETTLEKIGVGREKKGLEFIVANGMRITRSVSFAIIYVENTLTTDEVVFAEKGDLVLLGARTLEGLNLAVEPLKKKLVVAGPLPVAACRNAGAETGTPACRERFSSAKGLQPDEIPIRDQCCSH